MTRFSKLDFDKTVIPIAPTLVEDAWPNLDENGCLQAGDERFGVGDYEIALTCYSRALRFNRDCISGWIGQARCLIAMGEYPDAVTWSDRALERFADTPELLACKGLALAHQADWSALEYLDGAVQMKSPPAWVWIARGEGLLLTGQNVENAQRCFLKAQELAPTDPQIELRIAMAYIRSRQFARARILITAVMVKLSRNVLALTQAGITYEGLGEYDAARGFYERALAIRSDYATAQSGMNRVLGGNPFSRLFKRMCQRST